MRDFNKVRPEDIDQEEIKEAAKKGEVTCGYKDLIYYCKRYWIFGVFITLYKEIFTR